MYPVPVMVSIIFRLSRVSVDIADKCLKETINTNKHVYRFVYVGRRHKTYITFLCIDTFKVVFVKQYSIRYFCFHSKCTGGLELWCLTPLSTVHDILESKYVIENLIVLFSSSFALYISSTIYINLCDAY